MRTTYDLSSNRIRLVVNKNEYLSPEAVRWLLDVEDELNKECGDFKFIDYAAYGFTMIAKFK